MRVLETKPGKAVTIIECDMNVSDFSFLFMFFILWLFHRLILHLLLDIKSPKGRRKQRTMNTKKRWGDILKVSCVEDDFGSFYLLHEFTQQQMKIDDSDFTDPKGRVSGSTILCIQNFRED
jgi:hypothetical protein